MIIKPSHIRFADKSLEEAFNSLKDGDKSEQELFHFLSQAFENIEKNAFCGIQIPKDRMPKEYAKKYGVRNVWKYDLPKAWRLVYSIKGEELIVVSIILEWFNHKEYERRFKY